MRNLALGWIGYDLLGVVTPPHFHIIKQPQMGEWRGYK
jgi:hypothetical protein